MPKRKMIEVGARRLDKLLNEYIDNIDGGCEFCPAFTQCDAKRHSCTVDGVMLYGVGSTSKCKQYLKRWLTCQN